MPLIKNEIQQEINNFRDNERVKIILQEELKKIEYVIDDVEARLKRTNQVDVKDAQARKITEHDKKDMKEQDKKDMKTELKPTKKVETMDLKTD